MPKREILEKLKSDDSRVVADTLLDITFNCDDWAFVQDECLFLMDHEDLDISGLAITCLGHLARIHHVIDCGKVLPKLHEKRADGDFAGLADDALDDIKMFAMDIEGVARIIIDFTVDTIDDEVSEFELGDICIRIGDKEITSKHKSPSQAMMIFLSVLDLLDCVRLLIENREKKTVFCAADSSFSINFKRDGNALEIEYGHEAYFVDLHDFSKVLFDSAKKFIKGFGETSIRPDLDKSLNDFESALRPGITT